jgi:hypothetical protein
MVDTEKVIFSMEVSEGGNADGVRERVAEDMRQRFGDCIDMNLKMTQIKKKPGVTIYYGYVDVTIHA